MYDPTTCDPDEAQKLPAILFGQWKVRFSQKTFGLKELASVVRSRARATLECPDEWLSHGSWESPRSNFVVEVLLAVMVSMSKVRDLVQLEVPGVLVLDELESGTADQALVVSVLVYAGLAMFAA